MSGNESLKKEKQSYKDHAVNMKETVNILFMFFIFCLLVCLFFSGSSEAWT